jgi:hypothetical protein
MTIYSHENAIIQGTLRNSTDSRELATGIEGQFKPDFAGGHGYRQVERQDDAGTLDRIGRELIQERSLAWVRVRDTAVDVVTRIMSRAAEARRLVTFSIPIDVAPDDLFEVIEVRQIFHPTAFSGLVVGMAFDLDGLTASLTVEVIDG